MSRQVPLPARVRPGALSAGCLALALLAGGAARLPAGRFGTVTVYIPEGPPRSGEGESDSICAQLSGAGIAREQIGRGHHFSGEYARLADRILAFARSAKL
jgi:hypothetical protein